MKEMTISEISKNLASLRDNLEKGPVRIVWKEQKPGGKVTFSAIIEKEEIRK